MTVGENIRAIRKRKGLTQKALGELLGVSQATVGQYETNKNPPKIETLQKIANKLGASVFELLGTEQKLRDEMKDIQKCIEFIKTEDGISEDERASWLSDQEYLLQSVQDNLAVLKTDGRDVLEEQLIKNFRKLNNLGKTLAVNYIETLTKEWSLIP